MKLYIAGPMTGIPEFNFPAFEGAARVLRDLGHEVISPAEEDVFLGFIEGTNQTTNTVTPDAHHGYMRRDIPIVLSVDGVVMLPGWINSKGAVIEYITARAIGLPVFGWFEGGISEPMYLSDAGYMQFTQTLRKVVE